MRYYVVFFFKQKTAYEMRISDWSSDVCSSDLSETAVRLDRRCSCRQLAVADGDEQPARAGGDRNMAADAGDGRRSLSRGAVGGDAGDDLSGGRSAPQDHTLGPRALRGRCGSCAGGGAVGRVRMGWHLHRQIGTEDD